MTVALSSSGFATAQETQGLQMVGVGEAILPKYPGADSYNFRLFPIVRLFHVSIDGNSLKYAALRSPYLDAGPLFSYTGGRRDNAEARLEGMGDIAPTFGGGAFLRLHHGPADLSVSVSQALNHRSQGLSGHISANLRLPVAGSSAILAVGPDLEFANTRATQTWFGVSSGQAEASGLPEFHAHGGIVALGAHAVLSLPVAQHLLLSLSASLKDYRHSVGDSPVVLDTLQRQIGLGAAYRF